MLAALALTACEADVGPTPEAQSSDPQPTDRTLEFGVYGSDEERHSSALALESAKGVLRKTVGQQTGVRYTPSLQFIADVVPETAGRIDELLARARAADAQVHAIAESATPAGDAEPYRAPRPVGALDDEDE